ncbi:MAG: M16 family metallopeptidase [Bacteroidales bacterium]
MKYLFLKKFSLLLFFSTILFKGLLSQTELNFNLKQFKLDNGLTVILSEDHNQPMVYGVVVTKAGSKNDPADATGMAHYMEHMLFKGTEELGTIDWSKEKPYIDQIINLYEELGKTTDAEKRKEIQKKINDVSVEANKYAIPNELDKVLKQIGSTDINANTSTDRTVFYNAFPSNEIERWIEIYSHRFYKPVFRGFQSELETVYEEKNLYSDMFQFNLFEEFNKVFFKNHPYGQQPLIGTIDHLKNPSLNKMYQFFNTYYVPNNMALVLVGDFDSEKIIPLIKEKFGLWKSKEIPKAKTWEEKPFNGREFVEKKLSPIKLEMLGFRAPKAGDKDEIAMQMCASLLSNKNFTGLLDKLTLDHKLLTSMAFYMPYNDLGQFVILAIPKVIGQKLEDAEKIVLEQIERLRKGDFSDELLQTIKLELYRQMVLELETNEGKAMMLAEMIGQQRNVEEIYEIPKRIMSVSKLEIMSVAQKYLNGNYLAFYSRMGSMKKEKLEKPGFKPVIANNDAVSDFAKKLEQMPNQPIKEKFIDFRNDIQYNRIKKGINIYRVENPYNNIFTLKLKYGMGEYYHPLLKYACQLVNLAGTTSKTVDQFKFELAKIGCTLNISSNKSYTTIELMGIEDNLKEAIALLNEFIQSTKVDASKLNNILQEEKSNRKIEQSEPAQIAQALYNWVVYGRKSTFLDRPTLRELKKFGVDSLIKVFKLATTFECDVHYTGKKSLEEIIPLLKNNIAWVSNPKSSLAPADLNYNQYNENTVFFINEPKALQSNIYFFMNQKAFYNDNEPYIDAFNAYFSGDFSGLVLQEIREYRSMAYSAGAHYVIPSKSGKESFFMGYIGTQADKTIEAIQVFDSLVRFMPQKADRWSFISNYLVKSSLSNRPNFRNLSESVVNWKLLGYQHDPNQEKILIYYEMKFDDIVKFYQENIQKKPMVVVIVGDKKRIDMKKLSRYGKIVTLKKKDVFRN